MPTIETLTQGSTPTLLQAEKGNELIEYVNSLMSSEGEEPIDVEVDTDGKMTVKLNGNYSPSRAFCLRRWSSSDVHVSGSI